MPDDDPFIGLTPDDHYEQGIRDYVRLRLPQKERAARQIGYWAGMLIGVPVGIVIGMFLSLINW